MIKKLSVLFVALLLIGVSLTLYLPAFDPSNLVTTNKQSYQINQPSLKKPLLLSETSLKIQMTEDDFYGLQLGMFSQLQQAITMGKKNNQADKLLIVKVKDKKRYWYLLIHGPYTSREATNQQKTNRSATLIRWPINPKEASDQTIATKES
jgi:hypothetical protein